MKSTHISSETELYAKPKCPACGTEMWLTRIEPDEPGFERRLFECSSCGAITEQSHKVR